MEKVEELTLVYVFVVKNICVDGSFSRTAIKEVSAATVEEAKGILLQKKGEILHGLKDPFGIKIMDCEFEYLRSYTQEEYVEKQKEIAIGQSVLEAAHFLS